MKIGNLTFNSIPVILAPMEDITDSIFRQICKQYGADITFTEFTSSEALKRNVSKSIDKITFSESERPIAIQIFGNNADTIKQCIDIINTLNPDIIDINLGCPVKKVVNKGAGAALLKDIKKIAQIAKYATSSTSIPITAKTRLGWDHQSINIIDVVKVLQDNGIKAVTIHCRTRSQLYSGNADWSYIGKVKQDKYITIPIIANGDINSPEAALKIISEYNPDGIMIGRAAIGNPFIFRQIKQFLDTGKYPSFSNKDKAIICKEHLNRLYKIKQQYAIIIMRKHYPKYFKSIPHFKQYKLKLLTSTDINQLNDILDYIISTV